MRYRIGSVLQKTGLVIAAFFLLFANGSKQSGGPYADKSLRMGESTVLLDSQIKAKDIDPAARASIAKSYGKLPLSFEVNNGQVDETVKYLSKGNGYTLFLTSTEAVMSIRRGSLKEKNGHQDLVLKRANPNPWPAT